jgi:predicted acetyltransferase
MKIDVRTITDDEVPAWSAAVNTGFLSPTGDIDAEARRPGLHLDRTWGGFDGDRVVATLRSFPVRLTVPGGGSVPTSAVTVVTTTSTHRRRGIASRLVHAELAASAARGEQASVLIAAEWGIYGRFGYGAATEHQTFTVDAAAGRLRERPQGTVEYVDRDTARAHVVDLYERHRAVRPGEFTRADRFWDIDFGILWYPSWKEPKPAFHVLARDPSGAVTGCARYEYEDRPGRGPNGVVNVRLLLATEPAAHALLWHHLLGLDPVGCVRVEDRPADEVLPWLLVDPRHARASDRLDFLWLRPLDVPGLLAARRYPVAGRLVLEVRDEAGHGAGRFALEGGPDAARCDPTGEPADLALDVGVLGSAYLGGYPLGTLAAAGLVAERTPGAVAVADAMLRWPVAPWCSTWF